MNKNLLNSGLFKEPLRADYSKSSKFFNNYGDTIFHKMSDSIDDSAKQIINSLQEQIDLSKAESESAKKEAFFSRVVSIISLVVSAICTAATIMALLEVV